MHKISALAILFLIPILSFAQFFVPSFVVAHHEGHKHSNLAVSDHSHSSSDIISLRKDVRRLIEKCHVDESVISC